MKTITFYKKLKDNGIEYYKPVSNTVKVIGAGFIIFGVATTFVPFTTIPSIALGCCLILGLKYNDAKEKFNNLKLRFGYKLGVLK